MKQNIDSLPATLLALALLLLPAQVVAQNFSLGGRIGLTAANAVFEDEHSNDRIEPRPGPVFGGVAAYRLNSVLSLQAELLVMQKGWAEFETGGDRKLTYLELPLLLGVGAPWTTSPHVLAGPSVGFELGCSITGVPEVGSVGCDDTQVEWDRAKMQFGIWLGLGVGRWFGKGRFDLQILGNFSLTDTNREALPSGYIRLANVTLSAAYKTSLGGS
jgi:hypothetical protein